MRLHIPTTSAKNVDGAIYAAIDEGGRCRVSKLRMGV